MRGAAFEAYCQGKSRQFLLTRLMRGAADIQDAEDDCLISTHAPHARRGALGHGSHQAPDDFYSRASCEARQV